MSSFFRQNCKGVYEFFVEITKVVQNPLNEYDLRRNLINIPDIWKKKRTWFMCGAKKERRVSEFNGDLEEFEAGFRGARRKTSQHQTSQE